MSEAWILGRMQEIRSSQARLSAASSSLNGGHAQLSGIETSVTNVATALDYAIAGSAQKVDLQVKGHLSSAAQSSRSIRGNVADALMIIRRSHSQLSTEYASLERQLQALREAEHQRRMRNIR